MVGAVKHELRSGGYGAEAAYHQSFTVNRIVIQHIVLLEKPRIGDEIVIDGIIADLDRGVLHHGIQIHGLRVAGAGIYFSVHKVRISKSQLIYKDNKNRRMPKIILKVMKMDMDYWDSMDNA